MAGLVAARSRLMTANTTAFWRGRAGTPPSPPHRGGVTLVVSIAPVLLRACVGCPKNAIAALSGRLWGQPSTACRFGSDGLTGSAVSITILVPFMGAFSWKTVGKRFPKTVPVITG